MDDFADDEETAVLENLSRGVSEVDGALDAIAKAELLRQADGHAADRDQAASATDLIDDVAPVMGLDLLLHGCHHRRGAEIDLLARSRAARDQVRCRAHCTNLPANRL